MPEIIDHHQAKKHVRDWLKLFGGFPNPKLKCCKCGKYGIKYDDPSCTNPNHYAFKLDWRCGEHSHQTTKNGDPYLCSTSDRNAFHIIPDLAFEGLCPKCLHTQEEHQAYFIQQQGRRHTEREMGRNPGEGPLYGQGQQPGRPGIEQQLEQEQLQLLQASKERQEAIRRSGDYNGPY
ncbi:hypothetical protein GGR51DRAFT_566270 [Nemania sp. FL0031]|nr:hypothetical protein GGR51DRAFT_566270 [Nemania sp. FL0031]